MNLGRFYWYERLDIDIDIIDVNSGELSGLELRREAGCGYRYGYA